MIRRGYIIQECILVFLRGFGRSSLIFVRNSVFYGCVACHDLYPSVPPRFVSGFSRFRRFIFLACLIPKDDSDTFIVIVPRSPLTTGRLQFQDVITGFILFDYSFREDRELGVPGNPYSDKMTASCSFRQIQGVKQHEQVKHQGCSCKLTSNAVDWIVTRAVSSPPMRAF
jgi:hypothetical protein